MLRELMLMIAMVAIQSVAAEDIDCTERFCTDDIHPVCSSTNETFTNECEFENANCASGNNMKIQHKGACEGDGNDATSCDTVVCTKIRVQVCASNKKLYRDECDMKMAACREGIELTTVDMDECNTSPSSSNQSTSAEEDATKTSSSSASKESSSSDAIATDECNMEGCRMAVEPVCASDGNTYANKCTFNLFKCILRKEMSIKYKGKCK